MTEQLSPRLQLAGMAMQGKLSKLGGLSPDWQSYCLAYADKLLEADAASKLSDVNEMARTITKLQERIDFLRSYIETSAGELESARAILLVSGRLRSALAQDSEAAK